jgi:transposase InsO family protein
MSPWDRGGRNARRVCRRKPAGLGMIRSMRCKGNCRDEQATESRFNSFKNEPYPGLPEATHAETKANDFAFIEVFYYRGRQHSTFG